MLGSANEPNGMNWSIFATCNTCGRGVVFHFADLHYGDGNRTRPPHDLNWYFLAQKESWLHFDTSPGPRAPQAIEHLPANVDTAFMDAERSYAAHHISAAGMMYRKAVERAVKLLNPDGKGLLNRRIRDLEKANALPQSLIDLMDHVKLIGNDSAHEDEDPSAEDVEVAREFTRLLLTYLFELPGKVALAAERRAAIEAGR